MHTTHSTVLTIQILFLFWSYKLHFLTVSLFCYLTCFSVFYFPCNYWIQRLDHTNSQHRAEEKSQSSVFKRRRVLHNSIKWYIILGFSPFKMLCNKPVRSLCVINKNIDLRSFLYSHT